MTKICFAYLLNKMKNRLLHIITVSIALLVFINSASAQIVLPNPLGNTSDFPTLIDKIATYIAGFIASLAVIMIIWAGILFITSGGSEHQVSKAKRALIYAAIGLAIAIAGKGLITLITFIISG